MRSLVIVLQITDTSDMLHLTEAIIEELLSNCTIVICTDPEIVPEALRARCECWRIAGLGLFANDAELGDKHLKELLRRMLPRGIATESHYCRIVRLHIGSTLGAPSDFRRETTEALSEMLSHDRCALRSLDVSATEVDGWELVQALKGNSSLTALDVRMVPRMTVLFQTLADALLQRESRCRIQFLRCDAFQLLEGHTHVSLREKALDPGAVRLLAGLLRHNRILTNLDLTATGITNDGALALATALGENTAMKTLLMKYNPSLDDNAKSSLRAVAKMRAPALSVELS